MAIAAITPARSASRPQATACLVYLIPTLPKYTARMYRAYRRQRHLRSEVWLYGMCLGRFCRLRHSDGHLIFRRTKEIPYQLSDEGDPRICPYHRGVVFLHDGSQQEPASCPRPHREHSSRIALHSIHHKEGFPIERYSCYRQTFQEVNGVCHIKIKFLA